MKKQKKTKYKEASISFIKIEPPKGRPMLHWAGKKPLEHIKSFPEQLVEAYNPLSNKIIEKPNFEYLKDNWQNLLFQGDNKEVLGYLLNNGFRGKIDLVYIDPPFDSGANYVRKTKLRGLKSNQKMIGEDYNFGEQLQYFDIWNNDGYLQFIYERFMLLKELMSNEGFIFLHCDYHKGHYLKLIMDEVFGIDNFRNEIVVKRVQKNFAEGEYVKSMNNSYDTMFLYSKGKDAKILPPREEKIIKEKSEENWHNFDAPNWSGGRPNLFYELFGHYPPSGNVWRWTKERAMEAIELGILRQNLKSGKPEYLVNNEKGMMVNNFWADVLAYSYNESYPTEKSETLLKRIIEIASSENQIVLDCFVGSGTAVAVAQRLNRRWIGCDINKGAIQTTSKRLQDTISEQINEAEKKKEKLKLYEDENKKHFTFATYKVNDYDLKFLHTEAIELAIEHLGIKRVKTDNFFEGTRGKKLVKMIDFNHPLSLMDLQLIQDELKKRPNEDRDVTVVCLGKELSTDNWIKVILPPFCRQREKQLYL